MFTDEIHLKLAKKVLAPSSEWTKESACWMFLLADEGDGYLLEHGDTKMLNAGDMAVLGPKRNVALRASQLGALPIQYYCVLPSQLSGLLSLEELHRIETLAQTSPGVLHLSPAGERHAQQFRQLTSQASLTPDLQLRGQLLDLALTIFSNLLPPPAPVSDDPTTPKERFEKLISELNAAELLTLSPSDLARRCCCTERHFSRLFREWFHCSLTQRKMELRLQKAHHLVLNTDYKIINVALESGFEHIGLFNTCFKRRFKVTPSRLRGSRASQSKKQLRHNR